MTICGSQKKKKIGTGTYAANYHYKTLLQMCLQLD